uniref:Uncharacterized protein n=1 Tax=Nelumbo nucifera TaxID=4432 RepID=A0A822XET2_NELNU|nr:TPA_asm: hypothetical protein HUJ06_020303 [Nelumbo nucifera]
MASSFYLSFIYLIELPNCVLDSEHLGSDRITWAVLQWRKLQRPSVRRVEGNKWLIAFSSEEEASGALYSGVSSLNDLQAWLLRWSHIGRSERQVNGFGRWWIRIFRHSAYSLVPRGVQGNRKGGRRLYCSRHEQYGVEKTRCPSSTGLEQGSERFLNA